MLLQIERELLIKPLDFNHRLSRKRRKNSLLEIAKRVTLKVISIISIMVSISIISILLISTIRRLSMVMKAP